MNKEFVMRGQTASGKTEVLNFSGYKPGYAYRLVELKLYPSENIGGKIGELAVSITAAKTYEDPTYPNFNNEGLIATACIGVRSDAKYYDDLKLVNAILQSQAESYRRIRNTFRFLIGNLHNYSSF